MKQHKNIPVDVDRAALIACLKAALFNANILIDFPAINWNLFCERAHDHGVISLLYSPRLKQLPLPHEVAETIHNHYEACLMYHEYCLQLLRSMAMDLTRFGRVVLMQGFALNEQIYKERGLRTGSDVDLLLPDGNLPQVREVLIKNGFVQYDAYRTVLRWQNVFIDLHEDLAGSGRIPLRNSLMPTTEIQTVPSTQVDGLRVLCGASLYRQTALHALKHSCSRLIWACDLAMIHERLQSSANVLDHVDDDLNRDRIIRTGFRYATKIFNLSPVPALVPALEHQSVHERITSIILNNFSDRPGIGELALGLCASSWWRTIQYLGASVFPSKPVLQQMYGTDSWWPLMLRRMMALIKMVAGK